MILSKQLGDLCCMKRSCGSILLTIHQIPSCETDYIRETRHKKLILDSTITLSNVTMIVIVLHEMPFFLA